MRGLRCIGHAARDSRGAVAVIVALTLPVLIGFSGLVIDVGNWFEHRRHLQMQADAGALAAGGEFRAPLSSCDNEAIEDMATSYSGRDHNAQIGGTAPESVLRAFNSPKWPNQSTPVDETVVEGPPCTARMIDLKLTETDLPFLLRLGRVVPFINAHARVSIRAKTGSDNALPVGVPDVDPRKARAIFVNEQSGAVIASTPLVRVGTSSRWSNAGAPVAVTIDAEHVGVRIVLSGSDSTTCGQPLVACYDAGSSNGLVHIRGWSDTPAGTAALPRVRGVNLRGGNCEDGYFTATAVDDPCTVLVNARVDFGAEPPPLTTRLYVKRSDANNNSLVALTRPAAAGGVWTDGSVPVSKNDGPVDVELRYRTGCPSNPNAACSGQSTGLGTVHRTFGAAEGRSGPLTGVAVLEKLTSGALVPGANSFQRCSTCAHDLVVSIELQSSLQNASLVSDPFVTLKVAGGGTSQNQALACGAVVRALSVELAEGCRTRYRKNAGEPCTGNANALWGTEQAWPCVAVNTGAVPNEVSQGLNLRFMGSDSPSTCTSPNNWGDFPDIPRGDPRVVEVFLTPFGAFSGSGNDTVPVTGFATFYVTGWAGEGKGFDNPCSVGNGGADDNAPSGSIVGHFIKYIDTLNTGGAGEEFCDFSSFGSCVAVLER